MPRVLVATQDGLHAFGDLGGAEDVQLPGRSVTGVTRAHSDMWAIVDGSEIWREHGMEWKHVADLDRSPATCIANIGDDLLIGTAQARLFRFDGRSLEAVSGFDEVEGRDAWYTPWGGPPDTRSIANWDDDTFVNVHVGGVPRSDDDGKTWEPTIDIDADVHQVTTAEGLVLAACAGGLAASADRGANWTFRTTGLEAVYSRALAVCGDTLLMSSSDGPRGGRAAVYRTDLSGGAFERCDAGDGWFDDNIDTGWLDALPDGSLSAFGTSDGDVYLSADAGSTWEIRASGLAAVHRVLVMP